MHRITTTFHCQIRRCLLTIILVGLTLTCFSGVTAAATADERDEAVAAGRLLIDRLQERLATADGLSARFEQINYWVVMDEADTARGSLLLAPPHRFRLDYAKPQGHLIGSDGTFIWTYLPDEKQVLRSALHHTTNWGEFFLEGLSARIDSSAVYTTGPTGDQRIRIDLGKHPEWGLSRLFIEIDTASEDPAAYYYVDEEGNTTRFEFLAINYPPAFSDREFQFAVPEGYELLDVD